MNKEKIVEEGLAIEKIQEISELREKYENWKEEVLRYVEVNNLNIEQCRMLLYIVDTPYESKENKIGKYRLCINKTIKFLQEVVIKKQELDALEAIINNFGLYLYNMFSTTPDKKATLRKEVLEQIVISNEYDVQHIMYAVIKALYPSARREVNQDIGYGTDRYDIIIEEIDTIIEIKCTRKDHNEKKLFRELGEDAYFYKCSRLIIYVYDKQHKIQDVGNFIRALERTKETAGKEVRVYVEHVQEMI